MIVRTAGGDKVAVRSAGMFAGSDAIPAPGTENGWTYAGRSISSSQAVGLPAAGAAVRYLSETTGMLPCLVRTNDEKREVKADAWQARLLGLEPNAEQTPFSFISYLVASLQEGNAYALKTKSRGRVQELMPLMPRTVAPFYKDGRMQYRVYRNGKSKVLTRDDLLHIPGILIDHPFIGASPVELHRQALGVALATEEFGGRYFANDGQPGGIISVKGNMTPPQKREFMAAWMAGHQGVGNAHRTGLLTNGATYTPLGVTLADASFIAAQEFSVRQVGRIYRVSHKRLGEEGAEKGGGDREADAQDDLTYSLQPWITRVEQALHADRDLFPDPTALVPDFATDALIRANFEKRWNGNLKARQSGVLTPNEIRRNEGYPPVEGGDVLQLTPVGGAPNPDPGTGTEETGAAALGGAK